jgi:hypothetical protein
VPPDNERWDDGLIPTGRSAEKIDDRGLLSHRVEEPAVIRRVRVGAHECIINDFITGIDLLVNRCSICRGFKMPRCGLISGMRSPPNLNPHARMPESSTPPRE